MQLINMKHSPIYYISRLQFVTKTSLIKYITKAVSKGHQMTFLDMAQPLLLEYISGKQF